MFKHVQRSNYYLCLSGCIMVLLCTFRQCYFWIFSYRIAWGSVEMLGYVAHVRTATSACSLLPAPAKEFQTQHFLALMHQTKSNTLLLKTQTMTACEKSEDNPKRVPLNKMGAPSARGIIFMNPDLDYFGI